MGNSKENSNPSLSTGEIVLYQPEGAVKLEVRVENETVWLTQAQMAVLFGVKEHTIITTFKRFIAQTSLSKFQLLENFE